MSGEFGEEFEEADDSGSITTQKLKVQSTELLCRLLKGRKKRRLTCEEKDDWK